MTKEEIDEIVCTIMRFDGPDRHIDGHDVITDFICALQNGYEYSWKARYFDEKRIYQKKAR